LNFGRLTAVNANGADNSSVISIIPTMVPNPKYSGPVKPKLSEFVETPFTTESAELNVLRSGQISVGYLPVTDIGQKQLIAGSGYTLTPWLDAGINYFPYNFNNPVDGPVFRQLYIRQAVQHLINQPQFISTIFQGYASPTYGPVPVQPANPFVDSYEKANPYKFSVSAARQLLTSHGWTVPSNGAATCARPGAAASECGAGVKSGAKLDFNLLYASGTTALTQEMQAMKSTFSQVGIVLNLSQAPARFQVVGQPGAMTGYFAQAGVRVAGPGTEPATAPPGPDELQEIAARWGITFWTGPVS